ncbi:MAG: hypothetical protein M1822_005764 [Bathelium mastoideum]|nr:MAG: hypothetical protein M1822_005764 [Bathelium mastoideum]
MRCLPPHRVALASCLYLSATAFTIERRQAPTIPDYVTQFAPLVYIDVNDPYLPSDIGAQIVNTKPDVNYTQLSNVPSNLDLQNLVSINGPSNCSSFDNCFSYLTSRETPTTDQPWLHGILPDSLGKTEGATSAAVVVNDHGNGLVDAFYFYFYAFNLGEKVNLTSLGLDTSPLIGNHVGDWENGVPQTIWYSAHDSGFVYTYEAVAKNNSRPIVYASLGGHANYPTPGTQTRFEVVQINDSTSAGPLWDPVASAYFYTFSPSSDLNGTFTAAGSTPSAPTSWLYYLGMWGDKQLPDSNPNQLNLSGIAYTWEDGPTGPLDKFLNRSGTCPPPNEPCNTTTTLPRPSGNTSPAQTISRTEFAPTVAGTTTSTGSGTATKSTSSGSNSPTASTASSSAGLNKPRYYGFIAPMLAGVIFNALF